MASFRRVDDEKLAALLRRLVDTYHDELQQAKIVLVWRSGEWDKPAATRKLSGSIHELVAADFVVELNEESWEDLTEKQREAVLDHELCHCAPALDPYGAQRQDADGHLKWTLLDHDCEEFVVIIQRHGLWQQSVERAAEAARPHLMMRSLFNEPGVNITITHGSETQPEAVAV